MNEYPDFTLFDDTVRLVLPWVNSIGLNEQELHILHHYIITGEEAPVTTSRPTVAHVTEQISDVIAFAAASRRTFQSPKKAKRKEKEEEESAAATALAHLNRIHFHTLQFHIMCQKQQSGWQDAKQALVQAALMSTKMACGNKTRGLHSTQIEIDPERVEILLPRKLVVNKKL